MNRGVKRWVSGEVVCRRTTNYAATCQRPQLVEYMAEKNYRYPTYDDDVLFVFSHCGCSPAGGAVRRFGEQARPRPEMPDKDL
jgi:hypothetical protein